METEQHHCHQKGDDRDRRSPSPLQGNSNEDHSPQEKHGEHHVERLKPVVGNEKWDTCMGLWCSDRGAFFSADVLRGRIFVNAWDSPANLMALGK